MLVATSEVRIGEAGMRSTLVLEREVRGTVVLRDRLAFDTRFAATMPGKPEKVGYLFLVLAGDFVHENGERVRAPVGFVVADQEIERLRDGAPKFRTEGEHAHVIQLRVDHERLRVPIGLANGPIALDDACWSAAQAFLDGAPRGDSAGLVKLLSVLASSNIISGDLATTICAQEPEAFVRLWSAIQPLYQTYGGTLSLKQIASHLGLSMRQVGRDAKELTETFGLGGGFRDMLLVLRLRVAALLLSAKGATVAEVAKVVGYGSPIAMARAFRDAKLPAPSAIQDALRA